MALCMAVCVVRLPPKIWCHALSQSKFDISGHANWITQSFLFEKCKKKEIVMMTTALDREKSRQRSFYVPKKIRNGWRGVSRSCWTQTPSHAAGWPRAVHPHTRGCKGLREKRDPKPLPAPHAAWWCLPRCSISHAAHTRNGGLTKWKQTLQARPVAGGRGQETGTRRLAECL